MIIQVVCGYQLVVMLSLKINERFCLVFRKRIKNLRDARATGDIEDIGDIYNSIETTESDNVFLHFSIFAL